MRKLFLLVCLLSPLPAAAEQYGGFEQYADAASLKPFARDLGGVLGAGTFHSGRSLGLSGFDVGVTGGAQFNPEKGDAVLRRRGVKAFGFPWGQAEVGMPFRLSGFVRGTSAEGLTVAGGGLRYGLLKTSDVPWTPQLLVSIVAHAAVHRHFSVGHVGASLVGSMGTAVWVPFAGAGVDRVRLDVRSSLADPALNGTSVTTLAPRFTAGVRFKPWTFVYFNAAGTYVHGQPGAEAGLGIRF